MLIEHNYIAKKPSKDGYSDLEWLADQGAMFVHVEQNSKKPVGTGWQNKPLSLQQAIKRAEMGNNVGLLCGNKSHEILMLDFDTGYREFCKSFAELAKSPTIIRDNPDRAKILIKMNGGLLENQKWVKNNRRKVELLSNGSQGVVWGSVDGIPYRLINREHEIQFCTRKQLLEIKKWTESDVTDTDAIPADDWIIHEGERNNDLTSFAGAMRNKGAGYDEILSALLLRNALHCDPLLGDTEIERIAKSISTYSSKEEPQRAVLRDAAYALQPQPSISWIIHNLFATSTVNLIYGEPGSKKTYLMLSAGVCVAMGLDWLGQQTTQTTVLFVDEESGDCALARRLSSVLHGFGAGEDTPFFYFSLPRLNLREEKDIQWLHSAIEETKAKFVILDALADLMPGGDENAVKDVQPVFMGLRKIAEKTQSAIIVIHHANKTGKSYRGSTAMKGAVDHLLVVESKPESTDITISTEKARDAKPIKLGAKIYFFGDKRVYLEASAGAAKVEKNLAPSQQYVCEWLAANEKGTIEEIVRSASEEAQYSKTTIRKAVHGLVNTKKIHRVDGGVNGRVGVYAISETTKIDTDRQYSKGARNGKNRMENRNKSTKF
jgi:hypothetical protein